MKNIDPKISQYMSELAKKRKHPYHAFKEDPELAKKAGAKGRQTQKAQKDENQTKTDPSAS